MSLRSCIREELVSFMFAPQVAVNEVADGIDPGRNGKRVTGDYFLTRITT